MGQNAGCVAGLGICCSLPILSLATLVPCPSIYSYIGQGQGQESDSDVQTAAAASLKAQLKTIPNRKTIFVAQDDPSRLTVQFVSEIEHFATMVQS